jgi:hypothetical protein
VFLFHVHEELLADNVIPVERRQAISWALHRQIRSLDHVPFGQSATGDELLPILTSGSRSDGILSSRHRLMQLERV